MGDLDLRLGAADLLLGAACPACGTAARTLCPGCRRAARPRPHVVALEPLVVVAGADHLGVPRQTVLAWKEQSRLVLTGPLAHLLASATCLLLEPDRPVALVPVPTTGRSRRARGADVVDDLARACARLLVDVGADVVVHRALRLVRSPQDQSGLGAADRARNLAGAMAPCRVRGLGGRDVVVVDDVVTTGATLREAARALGTAAVPVLGAATVTSRP